ncbi:MAG: VWA domain-containing protein [Rhodospirillaceae bacterium]|nr:VWA domain-containing protein [Rhodospirillaceae bacterium]
MSATPNGDARDDALPGDGRLAENIMFFVRTLRAAGLPVGPGQAIEAIRAAQAVGIASREDFYWALHAVLVNRRDQRELFDQAFQIFWRNPKLLERMMAMLLPNIERPDQLDQHEISRRLAEALRADRNAAAERLREPEEKVEIDAVMTWSDREVLQKLDFEKMSLEELAAAKKLIARMRLPIQDVATRRFRPHPLGRRLDMRATMRGALRSAGGIGLRWRERRRRHPPLVVICDISGSMSRYSRLMLHFMHAITNDRDRVHTFLFGTRLTNVTRYLRYRDIDVALDKVSERVEDWSGGTRIGRCLADFNRDWSRRVLGQGAVVILVTDGLDRDAGEGLGREMERLHKSCRRLIWLNPLLRYSGYEPKSLGARAILPHVDEFRPVHNLESMADLTRVLGRPLPRRLEGETRWLAERERGAA